MIRSESIIKIVPGERYTPYGLAAMLGAKCILESSSFQKGRERYSVLLVREAFQLLQDRRGIVFKVPGDNKLYKVESKARDILDVCLYFAAQHGPVNQDFPFPAGGIGYLSYEFSRFCDNIKFAKQEDPLALPDAAYIFGHVFVVFDHYTDMLYIIGLNYTEARIDLETELADLEAALLNGNMSNIPDLVPEPEIADKNHVSHSAMRLDEMSDDEDEYKRGVEEVRKEIIAGNLLQGVLSRRLTLYSDVRALEAYRKLRSSNPSPYLFYLDFGQYQIFGSSPEVHVKSKAGSAVLRPIAGTRRRGATKEEDFSLEAELLSDPKERAEHLMLVDLGRNDLGRVCVPGSVKVTDYMTIERYSHVMHIVSQVEGKLSEGKTGLDVLRATFPAGTVSGAPKIRAIEILSKLEPQQRRFYAGAIGYMEPDGNVDTCIGIRCALKFGKQLVLQAGAGIVYDSTPERELEETREKMAAVLRSVGIDPNAAIQSERPAEPGERRSHRSMPDPDMTMSLGYAAATPSGRSEDAEKIQNKVDSIVEEKAYADKIAAEGPSVEDFDDFGLMAGNGDTELSAGAPSDLGNGEFAEHETRADEVGVEITPLDWDWDPSSATGSDEIQTEIDDLFHNPGDEGDQS